MTSGPVSDHVGDGAQQAADAGDAAEPERCAAPYDVSVVVPVYGCADCLRSLCERVSRALAGTSYQIVLIDDRSPDGAWETIEQLTAVYPITAIRLSRNFGQHAAITAGLAEAEGSWIVVMDCDLQDRPEEIPRLLAKASEGYDVVLARRKRRRDSTFRRIAARVYLRLIRALAHYDGDDEFGSFSVVSRKVAAAYLELGDVSRHYLYILHWLGFETVAVDVEHAEREVGTSSYTLGRLLRHAFDGVMFQSTVLLRWIVYVGFVVALGGAGLAVWFVCVAFLATPPPGWASLAVLTLVIGGFIIISTGVAGLYIGKIFEQVRQRPLYVVDRRIKREGPESIHRIAE
jgi:dolichol-phosphate mannosyltransferase